MVDHATGTNVATNVSGVDHPACIHVALNVIAVDHASGFDTAANITCGHDPRSGDVTFHVTADHVLVGVEIAESAVNDLDGQHLVEVHILVLVGHILAIDDDAAIGHLDRVARERFAIDLDGAETARLEHAPESPMQLRETPLVTCLHIALGHRKDGKCPHFRRWACGKNRTL